MFISIHIIKNDFPLFCSMFVSKLVFLKSLKYVALLPWVGKVTFILPELSSPPAGI
jgi:hypothetical protein